MNGLHFARCRAGEAAAVDAIYVELASVRKSRDKPKRGVVSQLACRHRSRHVGQLKRGCCGAAIYRCAKYDTYCTSVTPAQFGLPILIAGRDSGDRLTSADRACSICRANGEDE